jgi:hypothetical protein
VRAPHLPCSVVDQVSLQFWISVDLHVTSFRQLGFGNTDQWSMFGCREQEDPYIVNSIGNCYASLGQWEEARKAYQRSASIFQRASGFRDASGSSVGRSTAAALAQSNAALALVQLGDVPGAIKELEYVSRRQGGFVDSRAALAALYYDAGRLEDAEKIWEYACDNISVGCTKYRDSDWVRKARRWPPVMAEKLQNFVTLGSQQGASGDQAQPQAVAAASTR